MKTSSGFRCMECHQTIERGRVVWCYKNPQTGRYQQMNTSDYTKELVGPIALCYRCAPKGVRR